MHPPGRAAFSHRPRTGTQVRAHSLGWAFNQNSRNLNKYVNVWKLKERSFPPVLWFVCRFTHCKVEQQQSVPFWTPRSESMATMDEKPTNPTETHKVVVIHMVRNIQQPPSVNYSCQNERPPQTQDSQNLQTFRCWVHIQETKNRTYLINVNRQQMYWNYYCIHTQWCECWNREINLSVWVCRCVSDYVR